MIILNIIKTSDKPKYGTYSGSLPLLGSNINKANNMDNQISFNQSEWQLPPILLMHWGYGNLLPEFNHEIWWTCPHCGEVYDARWHQKTCPACRRDIDK